MEMVPLGARFNEELWVPVVYSKICFLSQVRAANLQELVYKNGQAGISKASVSITFDNRDKKNSPMGYEQYDEVVIQRQASRDPQFVS